MSLNYFNNCTSILSNKQSYRCKCANKARQILISYTTKTLLRKKQKNFLRQYKTKIKRNTYYKGFCTLDREALKPCKEAFARRNNACVNLLLKLLQY